MSKEGVKVRILDRDFTIACAPGEGETVEAAADYLNAQLQTVQAQSKVIGLEHTVVLAALNIANELLASRRDGVTDDDALERVRELRQRVSVVTGQSDASHL
ncbi:MAG: cell division protein ZapA [Proteobacteria bacterium]|nr:cell division protein ZapA [Pseudomonadota bacterium]MDP6136477.1 cell division protein ZapA [Arenicellales bacterium]HJP07734.1 cell division protein ZapA [Arenicellales bacterium]|tara:strand:- start:465 stop:770 length:306 start_codon:yes stop_codon:yes gene_type:complete